LKNKSLVFGAIILVCAFSPIAVKGQSLPHTFSANTAAKASEVNENFTYLLERFGTRKTTVNCNSGESITTALQNYNHIVISGVCTENINLDGETLPHRVVILEGSSSASDGITASSSASPVIDINYHVFVRVKNLTLKGGQMGLKVRRNGIALISNSIVESNSGYGICACGTSFMLSESNTIRNNSSSGIYATDNAEVNIKSNTISGHSGGSSITITQGAFANIESNTITGSSGNNAVEISRGGSANIRSNTIQSAYNGISVQDSSHAFLKNNTVNNNSANGLVAENNASVILAEGNTFSNNSQHGIVLWLGGSLNMWCDAQLTTATTISGNTNNAINIGRGGSANLCNLTITGSTQTGIQVGGGGMLEIKNSTISGSTKHGIKAELGATLNMSYVSITNNQNDGVALWGAKAGISNSTITGNNEGIRLNNGFLSIHHSTISGSTINAITSHQQSAINFGGGVIIENNGYGIGMHNSTLFQYENESSYIRNNTGYEIAAHMSTIGLNTVTVGGTSGSNEINLNMGSNLLIMTGTSITGTIWCDGSLNTGKFINDGITLNPTTSGC
jgi:parallel beta-helix repeat protein